MSNPLRSMPAWKRTIVVAVALVLAIASCGVRGREKDRAGATPSSRGDGTTPGMMIGPQGGTLAIQSGPATGTVLLIPPGALSKMVKISTRMTRMAATDLPRGVMSTGPVLDF